MSELELLLDRYLVYDRTTDRYVIGRREYHDIFEPRLRALMEKQDD